MSSLSRRHFLQLSAAAASFAAVRPLRAIEPIKREGPARLALSMAAYSFRQYMPEAKKTAEQNADKKLDMKGFIDLCADNHCTGAELTSYYFPKDVTKEQLLDIRHHADLRKIAISGTSVGNNFALPAGPARDAEIASVKSWIEKAAILGAPHIRIFAGAAKDLDAAAARKMCIGAIEEVCDYAGKSGIFLGLENHGGIVAEPEGLLEIVKAVKSKWFGVNLDTGNFHTADPYAALAQCAPYAVNVQLKTEIKPAGATAMQPADLPRLIKILRDANYQGWVALEYEAKEDPYAAVPPVLATLAQLIQAPAPGAAAAANWTPMFDGKTLKNWKKTNFGGAGQVEVKDGELILDLGNDITGVNYTGELPKMDYEVSLEAKRLLGSDFFCGLTFPVGEAHVTLVVGGWGGSVVGISSINGDDASENETTQFRKFDSNKWYKIRVKVSKEKLEAWLDDEQTANVDTKDKKLAMRPGEIEESMPFGIATYRTKAALRNIQIRKF
jgi:sugar phosphate isomerase/epimerase